MYVSLSAVSRGSRASIDGVDKSDRHCEQKLMSCIFYIYFLSPLLIFLLEAKQRGLKKKT